jgi:hypothetical protein
VLEVVIADQPLDLREAREEDRPVDRYAAAPRRCPLDDLDAFVLRGGADPGCQRDPDRLQVERRVGDGR